MRALLIALTLALAGCSCVGEITGTFPQSGSSFSYRYAGTVFSKVDSFEWDGRKLTMVKADNSPILSAWAWGTAAGAAGEALDGVAAEAIDAVAP